MNVVGARIFFKVIKTKSFDQVSRSSHKKSISVTLIRRLMLSSIDSEINASKYRNGVSPLEVIVSSRK